MSTMAAERYSSVEYPWLNLLRALDLVDERLRHRLAGLVVPGKAIEELAVEQPSLVELRRQLHVVERRHVAGVGYRMFCSMLCSA